jgi:hypothetical protein
MRELDASANAKVAFELAKREQDVEMAKSRASEKEHEAHRASALGNLERVRAEEARKTMESKRENEKVRLWVERREDSGRAIRFGRLRGRMSRASAACCGW